MVMKTTPVTAADLAASVLSVLPLPRDAAGAIADGETVRLMNYLRQGGVSTFMFGGNANLYNMAPSEFMSFIELIERIALHSDWIVPSVGSDFGKALDQLAFLRSHEFPTAMVLPHRFPTTPSGVATGLRKLADSFGRPLIAYVKDDGYIEARDLGRLMADGAICAVKYAIPRSDPAADAFLEDVLASLDSTRIISGIGERPAIDHMLHYRLAGFTSGSVCVAPRLSTALLHALKLGDEPEAQRIRALFLAFEDLRDRYSPLRVLHAAVALAGIAETGPIQPFLSNIDDRNVLEAIEREAQHLRRADYALRPVAAQPA
jgi:4-hydroxy-tetrahydrodipicolinate synthase